MRILVAWADDASPNLGVRALGRGSIDLLTSIYPGAEIEMMNYGSRPPAVPWAPKSLVKERVLGRTGMMRWLSGFDVFWDTRSGDSFADIYGLTRHTTMSLIHEFAVQAGARAIMAPQTIGPFRTRRGRTLARRTLARSEFVFSRDPASTASAAELGHPVDATTTDMVFAINQPADPIAGDVVMNVSGLLWQANPHVDASEYRAAVVSTIEGLLGDGRQITLLPHVLEGTEADNDLPAVRSMADHFGDAVTVTVPDGLTHVRRVVAGANLVIGARMHACLNALSTGTPAIAMAYSRKFRPLLAELGWPHVVDIADAASTARTVRSIIDVPDLADAAVRARNEGQRRIQQVRDALMVTR